MLALHCKLLESQLQIGTYGAPILGHCLYIRAMLRQRSKWIGLWRRHDAKQGADAGKKIVDHAAVH
jgi:hypothetical protein